VKALSISQPYASLIVMGIKTVENRHWKTYYRGPLLIHATRSYDLAGYQHIIRNGIPNPEAFSSFSLPRGGVIGMVDLCGIDPPGDRGGHPWADPAYYGWLLANARELPFVKVRGMPGLFWVDCPEEANADPDAQAEATLREACHPGLRVVHAAEGYRQSVISRAYEFTEPITLAPMGGE
jgi:hypothetical protein